MNTRKLQIWSQKYLNYTFKKPELLQQALTHSSMGGFNNERLEFLGDSVLNLIITEYLWHNLLNASEGTLSRWRSNLVQEKTLFILAEQLKIPQHVFLSYGENKIGGLNKPSILADALEAVIAAIFIDSGIEVCRNIVIRIFSPIIKESLSQPLNKDPKTMLQEMMQAQKLSLPTYRITNQKVEAKTEFWVECVIKEVTNYVGKGYGRSRREAEQKAATDLLNQLGNNDISLLIKQDKEKQ